ncbi:MAG: hypothetical protein K8T25_12535 [Planctomycetia bacterium]|nr:hypothetical protein [Planctomycetia bacterium]
MSTLLDEPHSVSTVVATEPASVLDVSHDAAAVPTPIALRRIAAEFNVPPLRMVNEFVRLALGPGRIRFPDYVKYRLFDDQFLNGADKRAFVGQRRNRDLIVEINYRHDWYGILDNKIASASYLAAYGLPVIAPQAIFAPGSPAPTPKLLRSVAELRTFLLRGDVYPLFGKPVENCQSLGSIALADCDASTGELIRCDGRSVEIEQFLNEVDSHYRDGYVLQPLLNPHRDLVPAIGPRLATVRLVTIATADGPRVFRASWKIPVGSNHADNYWRSGNLLAGLDLETGKIRQVSTGTGFELKNVEHHPDTNADLIGLMVPNWSEINALAVAGANVLRHLAIIGWDIAPTDGGPVIVEANETPDFALVQIADRRGILSPEFDELISLQRCNAAAHHKRMKEGISRL